MESYRFRVVHVLDTFQSANRFMIAVRINGIFRYFDLTSRTLRLME